MVERIRKQNNKQSRKQSAKDGWHNIKQYAMEQGARPQALNETAAMKLHVTHSICNMYMIQEEAETGERADHKKRQQKARAQATSKGRNNKQWKGATTTSNKQDNGGNVRYMYDIQCVIYSIQEDGNQRKAIRTNGVIVFFAPALHCLTLLSLVSACFLCLPLLVLDLLASI